ncbi:MAG: hypothetical protein ACTSV2_02965 [Candidatus Thorarchaeota archaeon]
MKDQSFHSWLSIGQDLEKQGNTEKAMISFEMAIELKPNFTRGWYHKFMLHHKLGQMKEAEECAQKVIELEPGWIEYVKKVYPEFEPPTPAESPSDTVESFDDTVLIESELEERKKEPEPFEPIAEPEPDSLVGYDEMMARILEGPSKTEKIFGSDSKTPDIEVEKKSRERLEEAFASFEIGNEIDSELLLSVPFYEPLEKLFLADPETLTDSALRDGVKAAHDRVKKDKNDLKGWHLLASYYVVLRDVANAESAIRKSLLHNPEFSEGWFLLGVVLLHMQKEKDAFEAIEEAHKRLPDNKLVSKYYGYVALKVKFASAGNDG